MARSRCASACLPSDAVSAITRSWSAVALAVADFRAVRWPGEWRCRGRLRRTCDFGVAANAGYVRPAHVGDVFVLVADLADGEGDDFEAHLRQVVEAGGAHAFGHHFGFLDDLLDGELADDAAQVAFHNQADEAFALGGGISKETARPR